MKDRHLSSLSWSSLALLLASFALSYILLHVSPSLSLLSALLHPLSSVSKIHSSPVLTHDPPPHALTCPHLIQCIPLPSFLHPCHGVPSSPFFHPPPPQTPRQSLLSPFSPLPINVFRIQVHVPDEGPGRGAGGIVVLTHLSLLYFSPFRLSLSNSPSIPHSLSLSLSLFLSLPFYSSFLPPPLQLLSLLVLFIHVVLSSYSLHLQKNGTSLSSAAETCEGGGTGLKEKRGARKDRKRNGRRDKLGCKLFPTLKLLPA